MNDQLAWMQEQLARITYKPGWELTLTDHGPVLVARFVTTDSRNPNYPLRVKALRAVAGYPDPDAFARSIKAALLSIEEHELDEWLKRDGQLLHDPHADPDHWQCSCGGAGPKRESPHWTCPGCGKEHTT